MSRTNNPIPYTSAFATPANQTELVELISRYDGAERAAAMAGACMALNLAYTLVEEHYDTSVPTPDNALTRAQMLASEHC